MKIRVYNKHRISRFEIRKSGLSSTSVPPSVDLNTGSKTTTGSALTRNSLDHRTSDGVWKYATGTREERATMVSFIYYCYIFENVIGNDNSLWRKLTAVLHLASRFHFLFLKFSAKLYARYENVLKSLTVVNRLEMSSFSSLSEKKKILVVWIRLLASGTRTIPSEEWI